jgi:hypothetical protein
MNTYNMRPFCNKILQLSLAAGLLAACGCKETPAKKPASQPPPSLPNLAPLGKPPVWDRLAPYAKTMREQEFRSLLETYYAQPLAWMPHIQVDAGTAQISRETANAAAGKFPLPLASVGETPAAPPSRYWCRPGEIPAAPADRPLAGARIAIDPGHIGGDWAAVEERFFQPDERPPIQEGTLTLVVAKLLRDQLTQLGATVTLLREATQPVTSQRPEHFHEIAYQELLRGGIDPAAEDASTPRSHRLQWNAEKLFYRTAEIRERARLVNDVIKPDFVLCLHFNADSFPGKFTPENHLHMLLNGAFAQDELLLDDQRFEMLSRLLDRIHEAEIPLSAAVGRHLQAATQLPAFTYTRGAIPVPNEPYLWVRNLLANRLYRCPVAYCEPFLMNNEEVYERLLAGDFEGVQPIGGRPFKSIFREYAEGVAAGVLEYVRAGR